MGLSRGRASKNARSSILIFPAPTICWSRAYLATNKLPQAVNQLQAQLAKMPNERIGAHDAGAGI